MSTLADVFVQVRPDSRRLGPELKSDAERAGSDAGDAAGHHFAARLLAALAAGAAIGGALVVKGLKAAVQSASDLAETTSKIGVLFGDTAAGIIEFGDHASAALGQSKQTALDGAAAFAIYAKAAGLTGNAVNKFSIGLVGLATDVGSFSNADPAQVIEDFGSALRGEFDPVEKYGILLNETTVKAEALKLGIIKTTTAALTPQQRVLAVNSLLWKQTSAAQGDFDRTSQGLANQQRILKAQFEDLSAEIGAAFLPIVTRVATVLTTKVMPALAELWKTHGPAVIKFLEDGAAKFEAFVASIDIDQVSEDLREFFQSLKDGAGSSGEAGKTLDSLKDSLSVFGVVIKFAAEHTDELAKALPYLVGGLVAYKTAQLAANVAAVVSPIVTVAAVVANRRLAASQLELAAALGASTAATAVNNVAVGSGAVAQNAGIVATLRATAATVAHKVAMVASAIGTGVWTVAQWLLNTAFYGFPLVWIIAAIIAVIAIIVLIATKTTWFQDLWKIVWTKVKEWFVQAVAGIKIAAAAIVTFFTETIPNAWNKALATARSVFTAIKDAIVNRFNEMVSFAASIPGRIFGFFSDLGAKFRSLGGDIISGIINGLNNAVGRLASAAADMAKKALGAAKSALGIGSPSKVFEDEVGRPIGAGTIVGIDKSLPKVRDAGARLGHASLGGAQQTAGAARAGQDNLLKAVRELIRAVREVAPGVGAELTGAASSTVRLSRAT